MGRFDYAKFRKTLIAAVGAALMVASRAYTDNVYVQAVVAVATVFGVFQVRNDDDVTPAV